MKHGRVTLSEMEELSHLAVQFVQVKRALTKKVLDLSARMKSSGVEPGCLRHLHELMSTATLLKQEEDDLARIFGGEVTGKG